MSTMLRSDYISGVVTTADLSPSPSTADLLEFETLLSDISAQLIAATSDRIGETIESALEAIRHFFRVDRCGILAVSDIKDSWNLTYAAYGEDIPHVSGEINLALLYPWITHRVLFDEEPVIVSSLDEMPPEAATDRASCEDMGIVSFLNIPIKIGRTRVQLLVMNALREQREWPQEYVPRLRLLGQMMVNSLERARASDHAREQGTRVAAAVDAAELGFAEWTHGTEQPYLDSRLCDLLGLEAPESEKANEFWLARVHAESRPILPENRRRLRAGESERASVEYRYDHPRRGPIWLRQSSRRVEAEPGQAVRIIEVIEDVTERAGRIEFETLLSNISAQLIAVTADQLEETIVSALDSVRRFFKADRCCVLDVTDSKDAWQGTYTAYEEGVSFVPSDINLALLYPWLTQRILFDQEPVIVSSLDEMPPEAARDRASCEAMNIVSFFAIPIKVGPTGLRMMILNAVREQRRWPEEYLPRLRVLGEMLVNRIERIRAWDRARKEAARVAAAVDAAELGFAEWTCETEPPYFDSRLCDLLGIDAPDSEKVNEFWIRRVHAESRPILLENHRRLLKAEIERASIEYRYDHPRRGPIWLRQSSRRVEAEPGQAVRIIEAIEDVTERRQALEDLQRLRERLERENVYLREEVQGHCGAESIIGRSAPIRRTLALAEQVAPTDSTVLLRGETGSGKERFASYIHECSRRHDRPMIRVNCSAIPTTLIESELFGREKGAYTGAASKQICRFELAHGSTIFLDEIGELPVEVQAKLLRVLESHAIERLGNPRPISVDVRIIAATHRDLSRAIRDGHFREDLYYRLNVFPISIPPLRERREDIPMFVLAFVDEFVKAMGKPIDEIDSASLKALTNYAWPGNVRELRNVVERAMIMAPGPCLQIAPLESDSCNSSLQTNLTALDRAYLLEVLNETGWRVRGLHGAAARLGLKPTTLESRIKKLGLTRPGTQAVA